MWKLRAERFRAWPTEEAKTSGSAARPKDQDRRVRGSERRAPCPRIPASPLSSRCTPNPAAFHYHVGSQRPARRHQEGGRRVTAAARDRPEPAPAAADTYLTRQSAAAETTPRGALAHARSSNSQAPPLSLPEVPCLVLKTAFFATKETRGASLSASFLLTP